MTPVKSWAARHFSRAVAPALLSFLVALVPAPALADQFKMAADNAQVDCIVSRNELTRISLIGDQFASLNKIAGGTPYNDFSVVNEPSRGDIYLSVPQGFAPQRLTFFGTTKSGFVYKFVCEVRDIEAQQVFVTNPALAEPKAREWEDRTPTRTTAVRLIQAMATNESVDGYEIRQPTGAVKSIAGLNVRLISEYRGGRYVGRAFRVENKTPNAVRLTEEDLAPAGTLAISIQDEQLASGGVTMVWVVVPKGGE